MLTTQGWVIDVNRNLEKVFHAKSLMVKAVTRGMNGASTQNSSFPLLPLLP